MLLTCRLTSSTSGSDWSRRSVSTSSSRRPRWVTGSCSTCWARTLTRSSSKRLYTSWRESWATTTRTSTRPSYSYSRPWPAPSCQGVPSDSFLYCQLWHKNAQMISSHINNLVSQSVSQSVSQLHSLALTALFIIFPPKNLAVLSHRCTARFRLCIYNFRKWRIKWIHYDCILYILLQRIYFNMLSKSNKVILIINYDFLMIRVFLNSPPQTNHCSLEILSWKRGENMRPMSHFRGN